MYLVCCLNCKLHVQSNSYVNVFTTGLTWLVIQDANISVIAFLLRNVNFYSIHRVLHTPGALYVRQPSMHTLY